jgi:hypothetical protein
MPWLGRMSKAGTGGGRHRNRPRSHRRGAAQHGLRDRHATSGAKSDPSDAKVLADFVRTDRYNRRPTSGDIEFVEGVKIIAPAHQKCHLGPPTPGERPALVAAGVAAFGIDLPSSNAIWVFSVAAPVLGPQLFTLQNRLGTAAWRTDSKPRQEG